MSILLKWFAMLNKRLYKKASFIAVLLLIPVAVISFSVLAKEESGFATIIVAQENKEDRVSSEIVNELVNDRGLLLFKEAESPEQAINTIEKGEADIVWIFPADMTDGIDRYLDGEDAFIRIIERDSNVVAKLSREKLAVIVYKHCAKANYIKYVRTNFEELEGMSDTELFKFYNEFSPSEELFLFGSLEGEFQDSESKGYLLSPVRGLLAVVLMLCGLAAILYYLNDEKKGTFAAVPMQKKPAVKFGCIFIAVLNTVVVMVAALGLSGLCTVWYRELAATLLFLLCCSSFCYLLLELFKSVKIIGALLPVLVVVMIAVCPIFFDLRGLRYVQLVFPPTYYINAIYSDRFLLYMLGYAVVTTAAGYFTYRFIRKGKN